MNREGRAKRAIVFQAKHAKANVYSISGIVALYALHPICQSDKRTDPVCVKPA